MMGLNTLQRKVLFDLAVLVHFVMGWFYSIVATIRDGFALPSLRKYRWAMDAM